MKINMNSPIQNYPFITLKFRTKQKLPKKIKMIVNCQIPKNHRIILKLMIFLNK